MVSSFEIINNEEPQNQQVFLNRLLNPSIDIASPLGDEQTKITIVEFADYQCPICAQFHRETMES
jgi:protein-disulfide isomerase